LNLTAKRSHFGKISCLIFIFVLFPAGILTASATQHKSYAPSVSRSEFPAKHFAGMLRPSQSQSKPLGGSGVDYDEQIANTFTQSFTSMAYNVTVIAQVDSDGCGPAYLLNGLSNVGYWYQVGLSYDWSCTASGFMMVYEVFNSSGASIFPTNGGGGLLSYTGTVNTGDIVLLNLYFGTGSNAGLVVMYSYDWNTGAYASETYNNEGASYFAGLSNSANNPNGFFTGLMTEQYHSSAYYGGEQFVAYSNPYFGLSSAWQWIDEYNTVSHQTIFASASSSPVTFTNFHQLQSFSSNGASELADAFVLDTGTDPVSMSLSGQPSMTDVGMQSQATFSASALGGTGPYEYLVFLNNNLFTTYSSSNGIYQTTLNFGLLTSNSHSYYIDVIDSTGYPASSQTISVTVNPDPSTSVTVNSRTIDVGQSETLSSSIQGGSPSYDLKWYLNGQQMDDQQTSGSSSTYSFKATSAGNFTVYTSLLDSADFSTSSSSQTFTVNQDPRVSWGINPQSNSFFISDSSVTASAVTSGGTAPYTYTWYVNGVKMSQTSSPNYTYSFSNMGQYNLAVNVTDSAGFIVASNSYSINYGYNFANIGILVGGLIAIVIAGMVIFLKRSRNSVAV
jgi:hypothetical protein